jgi:pyridoxal phosphate enzyme (YggS family)
MSVAARLESVMGRIERAAIDAGRDPGSVTLVAVGKTFPADVVREAVAAGALHLGENRVQEAAAKRQDVAGATWHLIGPLQRNKAGLALDTFDVIHTVDRADLVERLALLLERDHPGRRLPVLLEVNVGDERQKAGVRPAEAESLLRAALERSVLEVSGLMAIPPFDEDLEASRRYFRGLRELRERLVDAVGHPLPHLSMGMSHDFEVAIDEGATHVRVGSAIFGPRG